MSKKFLSETDIDEIVIDQTDDDNAWEKAIVAGSDIPTTISLPYKLATRAAFLPNCMICQ